MSFLTQNRDKMTANMSQEEDGHIPLEDEDPIESSTKTANCGI